MKEGVVFIRLIPESGNASKQGMLVLWQGEVIAEGSGKEVRAVLKDVLKLKGEELVEALDRIIENIYMFNGLRFSKLSCPIEIPGTARIFNKIKAGGYSQVEFRWTNGAYKYSVRAHTEIPDSPGIGNGNVWVVSRSTIGEGGVRPYEEILSGDKWVRRRVWQAAIDNQRVGRATFKETQLLKEGHFKAK